MKIHTILSPQLFSLFAKDIANNQVLIIDILRATTSMVVMLENGAESVKPVAGVEEAMRLKNENPALLIACLVVVFRFAVEILIVVAVCYWVL